MRFKKYVIVPGQVDLFPPRSDWVAPTELPRIPDGALVAIDCETNDRGLQQQIGPGWVNQNGWLCGVSWAWYCGGGEIDAGYAPIRHPDTPGCFELEVVVAWVQDLCDRCDVVFQNASYDVGWTGVRPTRRIQDTHTQAVLLNENEHSYSLDAIAGRLGIPGKDEKLLLEAVLTHGGNPKKIKEHIWRLPGRYVGPYAEQDAVATLEASRIMAPQIETQGLMDAYHLECDLAPYVIDMRRRGIRVDIDQAEANQSKFRQLRVMRLDMLREALGPTFRRDVTMEDIRSPRWLETAFTDLSVAFPRTAGGQGSFEKDWLEACPHPIGRHIAAARGLNDAAEKFIGTYILEHVDRGRLHAEIHQLRDDDGGTKTYRFSYANPPLQQMNRAEPDKANPAHKDFIPDFVDMGTMIRECFLPERGCVWGAPDYSQQEYRLIVHYSARMDLPKADKAVEYYRTDPKADYHNFVVSMTGLTRKKAKDANFAKAFGAGIPKFALMTGMALEEASDIMRTYDDELPFVSKFAERCSKSAESRGYVRLMDGRRSRFDDWEASWVPKDEWNRARAEGHLMTPCDRAEALARQEIPGHPWRGKRLKRAGTHKAGNRVIQGGAAVQTKKAMLACGREGLQIMLQMHDELCFSHATERESERAAEIMRDVVPLLVPTVVDNEHGPTWGHAKYTFAEAMEMVNAKSKGR